MFDYIFVQVINENNERLYPNLEKLFRAELDKIIILRNKENQQEYFSNVTGHALRQIRQENDN